MSKIWKNIKLFWDDVRFKNGLVGFLTSSILFLAIGLLTFLYFCYPTVLIVVAFMFGLISIYGCWKEMFSKSDNIPNMEKKMNVENLDLNKLDEQMNEIIDEEKEIEDETKSK